MLSREYFRTCVERVYVLLCSFLQMFLRLPVWTDGEELVTQGEVSDPRRMHSTLKDMHSQITVAINISVIG